MRVFICSRDDVVTRLDCDDASTEAQPVLEGVPVRCLAADRDRVFIGTHGAGALLSSDGGRRWERMELPERDVFSVAIGPADRTLYAGAEPSRLFVLRGGAEWTELEALQDIPSRERWSFPPRPWTHHVHWIAPDPHRRERLLVAIELRRVMLSEDGGESFSDHRPGAKRDAHAITWHPLADGRRTRPQATALRGASTAGAAGRRSIRDVSSATAGRSPPTPTIPTAGTSPPRPDIVRPIPPGERAGASTAGTGTLGASCRCPASRCRTRSPPWQASSSAAWPTGGCSAAPIAARAGRNSP